MEETQGLVQLATYKTAPGSLSKRGREQKASDLLPLLPHFPEDSFSRAPFLSDFLPRSRFYWVIRKVPNISYLNAQKKAIYDILLWNQCEGLAFCFHRGMKKAERIYALGKGKIKNCGLMREAEEFTTLEIFWNNTGHYPPLIVYDGSEQGSLLAPLLLHKGPFPVMWGFLALVCCHFCRSTLRPWGPFRTTALALKSLFLRAWVTPFSRKLEAAAAAVVTQVGW